MKKEKILQCFCLGGALLALFGMSLEAGKQSRQTKQSQQRSSRSKRSSRAAFNHRIDQMVRSNGAVAANCIPNAYAAVRVASGPVEVMTVDVGGFHRIGV